MQLKKVKGKEQLHFTWIIHCPRESTVQCQEKPHRPAISPTRKVETYRMSTWYLQPSRILPKKSTSFLPHLEYWSDRHGWGFGKAGSPAVMAPNHQRAVDLTKCLIEFIKEPTHEPRATPCLHTPSNNPRATTSMLCTPHPPHFGQFLTHAPPPDVQCERLQTACKRSTEALPSSGELQESTQIWAFQGTTWCKTRNSPRSLPLQD